MAPGETIRVAVRISRAKGLTGDVKVELIQPAHWRGLSVEALTLSKDQESGELVLKVGNGEVGFCVVCAKCGETIAEAKLELLKRE